MDEECAEKTIKSKDESGEGLWVGGLKDLGKFVCQVEKEIQRRKEGGGKMFLHTKEKPLFLIMGKSDVSTKKCARSKRLKKPLNLKGRRKLPEKEKGRTKCFFI